jgi:phage shock protein PspC (stress-responsive transcriptional regulator)
MQGSAAPCPANRLSSGNDSSCRNGSTGHGPTGSLAGYAAGFQPHSITIQNLIRILRVVLTSHSIGVGVIACFVARILIPEEPEARDVASTVF